EEFLLVLTIPADKFDDALELAGKKKVILKKIGFVTKGNQVMWESKEGFLPIPFVGYDNFKEWD
ncbi:MAG: hypothetical protein ACFFFK_13395, partial [Candidatus Thorarchaeota archaeon]